MTQPAPEFCVPQIRPPAFDSPHRWAGWTDAAYLDDAPRVLVDAIPGADQTRSFERSGPRRRLAFDASRTCAAILTSGGLCPGLNDVIRALVLGLHHHYGVKRILGIPNGYAGLMPPRSNGIAPLTPERVERIHQEGGSVLGSARIEPDVDAICDTLAAYSVDQLFCIGGDGTQRGALAIAEELAQRRIPTSVIGVPKTIDNDISWMDKTFGFDTAVGIAREAVIAAHAEAHSAVNGIGLVKLMGRDSGFIAANAALASSEANIVLVPEVPFTLPKLMEHIAWRLKNRNHCVIVAAEGAGQNLIGEDAGRDKSGNKLHADIGMFLKERINAHFKAAGTEIALKYIDPSYIIRAARANASDAIYCAQLGHHAVHAAMAGRGGMVVGTWNGQFINVPIPLAVQRRKLIDPSGPVWREVIESTGQPALV